MTYYDLIVIIIVLCSPTNDDDRADDKMLLLPLYSYVAARDTGSQTRVAAATAVTATLNPKP